VECRRVGTTLVAGPWVAIHCHFHSASLAWYRSAVHYNLVRLEPPKLAYYRRHWSAPVREQLLERALGKTL